MDRVQRAAEALLCDDLWLRGTGEIRRGGMIALVPTVEDAQRLTQHAKNGEPADELHLTLFYFGDASALSHAQQESIIGAVRALASEFGPLNAEAFGVALLNPTKKPCWVLNIGGEAIDVFRELLVEQLADRPDEHRPWLAHVTLGYGEDGFLPFPPESAGAVAEDWFGPLVFDRVRVAFAGEYVDVPFGEVVKDGVVVTDELMAEIERMVRGYAEGESCEYCGTTGTHGHNLYYHPDGKREQPRCPEGDKGGGRFSNDEGGGCEGASGAEDKGEGDEGRVGDETKGESADQPASSGEKGEPAQQPNPGEGLGKYMADNPDAYRAYKEERLARVAELHAEGQSTDRMFSRDPSDPDSVGQYSEARLAEQTALLDDLMQEASAVPSGREVVIMGGLPGAGKTTALNSDAAASLGIDIKNYAGVNPDDMKDLLVNRGMTPRWEGISPMEGAWLMHEESSTLAKSYFDKLLGEGKNIALDVTMGGLGSFKGDTGYLAKLAAQGYKIKMVYVDTRLETSLSRADDRHRRGLDKPNGGRMVPDKEILNAKSTQGNNSRNRDNFETLKGQADEWYTFDNDGKQPELVDSWDTRHLGRERALQSIDELDLLATPPMTERSARSIDVDAEIDALLGVR